MVLQELALENMPRLKLNARISRNYAFHAMHHDETFRDDGYRGPIKEQVVVGAKNQNIPGDVWATVWGSKRL